MFNGSRPHGRLIGLVWEGLGWRLKAVRRKARRAFGFRGQHWCRVVMDRATDEFITGLDRRRLDCLEVSGTKWRAVGFRFYESLGYPDYDVCVGPYRVEGYDVVIAEQVLEHVLWPYRAVRHVHQMLRPGGVFVVTTPFMIRVHSCPIDCCRWTEVGLKHLLAEGGFPLDGTQTGSWGNAACVRGNMAAQWADWLPWWHSLKNEAEYPLVVWAFARKVA
jgi:SAM-dependent methyltransferase